jgi:hypothetical protein
METRPVTSRLPSSYKLMFDLCLQICYGVCGCTREQAGGLLATLDRDLMLRQSYQWGNAHHLKHQDTRHAVLHNSGNWHNLRLLVLILTLRSSLFPRLFLPQGGVSHNQTKVRGSFETLQSSDLTVQ